MLRRRGAERRHEAASADLVVVGLGNPGPKYVGTRHNVGAEVAEVLVERHGGSLRKSRQSAMVAEVTIGGERVAVAVPQTFMNESGRSVGALVRRYGITDLSRLVIVHDELDLPVGGLKVKLGGGLAGHNGLRSIRDHLHSTDFGRVRIGVGKPPDTRSGADHVLRPPGKTERAELDIVIGEAADAVESISSDGYETAMNRFNR